MYRVYLPHNAAVAAKQSGEFLNIVPETCRLSLNDSVCTATGRWPYDHLFKAKVEKIETIEITHNKVKVSGSQLKRNELLKLVRKTGFNNIGQFLAQYRKENTETFKGFLLTGKRS